MKAFLPLLLLVLLAPRAFAAGGGNSIGNGKSACLEGDQESWSTEGINGNSTDLYVCHNGRYVNTLHPSSDEGEVHHASCVEGKEETFREMNAGNETATSVTYVCRHGVYVPKAPR
ncbi:MAG: hypothetical protein ACXVB9_12370 [Bdellovibrionota bacterium]